MILNFWENDKIGFYCMNHDEPVYMTVAEGESQFFACPRYFAMDAKHPDGRGPYEPQCLNRISFNDAVKIVEMLSKRVEADVYDFCIADYTGMKLSYRGIEVTVLEYSQFPEPRDPDAGPPIKLGILNHTALKR